MQRAARAALLGAGSVFAVQRGLQTGEDDDGGALHAVRFDSGVCLLLVPEANRMKYLFGEKLNSR